MPFVSTDEGNLVVFNLFEANSVAAQDGLLDAMRDIIDHADYPGWLGSTLHAAVDRPGTANYVQWRSWTDLEERYRGGKFLHSTTPQFEQLATSYQLIKTEVVYTQRHPKLGDVTEISPDRDDFTVIIVFGVAPENQAVLVDLLAQPDEWQATVPGYRSHAILRGVEGKHVLMYAQWDSKETYDAAHEMPDDDRPRDVRERRGRAHQLVTSYDINTYRVVHARTAPQVAAR